MRSDRPWSYGNWPVTERDTCAAASSTSHAGARYALPDPRELLTPAMLARPHHDYPGSRPGGADRHAGNGRTQRPGGRGDGGGVAVWTGVVIAGDDGATYTYCHASALHTEAGVRVAAGATIVASGPTGNSTGPHVHQDMRTPSGTRVCPQPLLQAWYQGRPATPGRCADERMRLMIPADLVIKDRTGSSASPPASSSRSMWRLLRLSRVFWPQSP